MPSQHLSGASWWTCPSAGRPPSWPFLSADGEKALLGFTLETLYCLLNRNRHVVTELRASRYLKEDTKLWTVFNKGLSAASKVYSIFLPWLMYVRINQIYSNSLIHSSSKCICSYLGTPWKTWWTRSRFIYLYNQPPALWLGASNLTVLYHSFLTLEEEFWVGELPNVCSYNML